MSNKRPKALDLFCGAGGAAKGLYDAGFDVVGVDLYPQRRFPYQFIQADATEVSFGGFDFIWASPPCQAYTLCQRIRDREHPDLIGPIRDKLIASGVPWCIENVPGAPLINPIELCGAMFGLRTYRHRLFECSFPIAAPPHPEHVAPIRKMGRPVRDGEFIHVVGNFSGVPLARKAMGIEWMMRDELREAIPPAFSEYVARAAAAYMSSATLADLAV